MWNCAAVACVFPQWGRDEEGWSPFHVSSKHKLLTTDSDIKKTKQLQPSILLNLSKSPWDCANAQAFFWPTTTVQHTALGLLRELTKQLPLSRFFFFYDLSPVFNPVTCEIPDHDLGPASLFGGKNSQFCLAVNRTRCNLVPEECHSRALCRGTLTTGPNWKFNYVKTAVALPY